MRYQLTVDKTLFCILAHLVSNGVARQVRTVPYLVDNPHVGFVQARWAFTNAEESFLTKACLLDLHCRKSCLFCCAAVGNGCIIAWSELLTFQHQMTHS